MKQKRSLASVLLELAAVLLVTALAFAWGRQAAQGRMSMASSTVFAPSSERAKRMSTAAWQTPLPSLSAMARRSPRPVITASIPTTLFAIAAGKSWAGGESNKWTP